MTTQVNVVMGGPSAEHEVSLRSGREVIANLNRDKYRIRAVVITKNRDFYYRDIDDVIPEIDELASPDKANFYGPFSASSSEQIWKGSVAFLALHGSYGEDGIFQGYLDTLGIPYTGSGVFSSALAMNKIASKYIFQQIGLTVPPYSIFGEENPLVTTDSISTTHGFPCFVKCPQSGSSRLMGRADTSATLQTLLDELINHSPGLLIETAIKGIEFSCGVLEMANESLLALPPIEIRPKAVFFDYTAKYTDGESEEIVPAPYPDTILDRIKHIALTAHKALGCRGCSRTDMIYKDDQFFVLETNTLPGLTPNSLLPKSFRATGGTFADLLEILINSALRKNSVGVS